MPTRLALQRCPDAIVLKGDFELFSEYSDIINEIVTERAPLHERASIDEFYIDMTGMDRFFGSLKFTRELVQKVQKETGLPMSFGLSVNKTVAKMCTNFVKPQGNLCIANHEVQPFLDPQSIKSIPSIGDVTYKLLRRIRIRIIETLRQIPAESMQELLGKNGLKIWKKANGIDQSPVIPYSSRKSVSTERTFDKDTQNIPELKSLLVVMIEKLAFQLRNTNTMCSTIAVRIRYANRDTETMQQKIAYTANDDILIKVASELFDKLYHRRMLLRLVGVKLSGLVPGHHQIDMFRDSIKLLKLYQAMDRMKHRFNNPILIRRATGFSAYES
jgi:DNA polymerase-4